MRRACLAFACAACRLNFDEVAVDDAPAPTDARAPLATPCNTPVLLHAEPAEFVELSAAATTSTLVASWLRSDGTVGEAGARIVPGGLDPFWRPALAGTWSGVALAARGDNVMSAFGHDTTSQVRFLDEHLEVFEHPLSLAVSLGSRGATALRSGDYPFVLAGTRSLATGAQALAPSELGPELDALAEPQDAVETVAFDDDFAIVSARGGTCRIIRLRPESGPIAPLATWGTACATPTAAHLSGRTDVLLAHHDTSAAAIAVTRGTLVGGGVNLPPERSLAPGSHPRAVATRDGYWIASHAHGTLEARLLDFAGEHAAMVSLGAAADLPGHDLVVHDGTAYALWLQPGDGLHVARLCR